MVVDRTTSSGRKPAKSKNIHRGRQSRSNRALQGVEKLPLYYFTDGLQTCARTLFARGIPAVVAIGRFSAAKGCLRAYNSSTGCRGETTLSERTLESLAGRRAEIERRLNAKQPSALAPSTDWRSVISISEDVEFTRLMLAEIEAAHEADRQAASAEEAPVILLDLRTTASCRYVITFVRRWITSLRGRSYTVNGPP